MGGLKIQAVVFDADGTLFDFKKGEAEAVKEAFLSVGIELDDTLVADYSAINDSLWKMLERGEIEKKVLLYKRFELFSDKHGFGVDAKQMASTYMNMLSQKNYLFEGAEELCKALCDKANMYIVTNGVEFIQKNRYKNSGLERYFKGLFISGAIGSEKPSREYFDYVAANVPNFSRESALIIGDSLSSDIKGGVNYGIDTCWYNPKGLSAPEDMPITRISPNYDDVYAFITAGSEGA